MTSSPAVRPDDVTTLVQVAQRVVPPLFGLDGFVAVNPLGGFEELPFETALTRAADLFDARGYLPAGIPRPFDPPVVAPTERADTGLWNRPRRPAAELRRRGTAAVAELTDVIVAHWCASHVAGGLHPDSPDEGLYSAWRSLAPHDPDIRRLAGGDAVRRIESLPTEATEAIADLLRRRGIGEADAVAYLEAQLARLPGWAAVLTSRSRSGRRRDVVDLVAVRLAVEHLLAGDAAAPTDLDEERSDTEETLAAAARQTAAERDYRSRLLRSIEQPRPPETSRPADAQVVCCIDVRSEGLRRHLESVGAYETFGFAGFFGLPIAVQSATSRDVVASCPVILEPRATIVERVVGGSLPAEPDLTHRAFDAAKAAPSSGFVLADAAGWLMGLRSLAQSISPGVYEQISRSVRRRHQPPPTTRFAVDVDDAEEGFGLSLDEQVRLAHGALTAMGLTDHFAPFVVLCGHRSANRNNPYRSALDCGACAGHAGGPNARILATICNRTEVRAGLVDLGLSIPDDTWFVAAEHETTDDNVSLLDTDAVPSRLAAALERIAADLATAGVANRAERAATMPSPPLPWATRSRAVDPAQVVPDWGLARCAAIVVGPRTLTAGLDLERRVFLHSYDRDADRDGVVLEAIMTGPVVVAHWISSQYYFSTVDPQRFGAGSKPLHNVIGRVGVAVGAAVDVRIGLPLESVWFDGRPVHDPLRLLVVVDAPASRVDGVIERNPVLQRLFDNGWATVAARSDDRFDEFHVRLPTGHWRREPPDTTGQPTITAPPTPGRVP